MAIFEQTAAGTEDLRRSLRGMWAGVSGWWADHAEYVDARLQPVADRMLEGAVPQPGERVLELACGPAGVGLAAAALVGPDGAVVLSDVAPEMTAIASRRARALGLTNVRTRELDLEHIAEPDRSHDVVLCRDGLMFVPDPARAAGEVRRILRPGGRAAIAVWDAKERNPWLGLLLDAVSAHVGAEVPPPGRPGPFSLGDAERLTTVLADAGLTEVTVTEVDAAFHASSFDEWWTTVPGGAGPLAQILASLPPEANDVIRATAQDAVSAYRTPAGGLSLPGASLVAIARRH